MTLTVKLDLPDELERRLRAESADLEADARAAFAIDLYRRRKLTHRQLSDLLGVDRFETDAVLKRHGVMLELTEERLAEELDDLRRVTRQ